jgi:hypothetical protein
MNHGYGLDDFGYIASRCRIFSLPALLSGPAEEYNQPHILGVNWSGRDADLHLIPMPRMLQVTCMPISYGA